MTHIGSRTVALLMTLYGLYSIWIAWSDQESRHLVLSLSYVAWGLFALVGGVCLFLNKRWSRFIVYLLALGLIGSFIYGTTALVQQVFGPHDITLETAIILIPFLIPVLPGILSSVVCIASCFAIHYHFRQL